MRYSLEKLKDQNSLALRDQSSFEEITRAIYEQIIIRTLLDCKEKVNKLFDVDIVLQVVVYSLKTQFCFCSLNSPCNFRGRESD